MIRTARFPLVLAALCLSAVAQTSTAQVAHVPDTWEVYSRNSSQIVRETAVVLADLDLSSQTGVQTLFGRIQVAADAVCGGSRSIYSDATRQQYSACRDMAIATAVARMRMPALTAVATGSRQPALAAK
jgi:UrcA family protein